jgi:hypothetical protein
VQISQGKKTADSLCFEGKPTTSQSNEAWNLIYSEYIEEFGVSEEYKHYTRERLKLCAMLEALYVRDEKWQRVLIEIKKDEIKRMEADFSPNESDFNVLVGKLSKKMGFGIDPSRTSIRQFYSYLKSL